MALTKNDEKLIGLILAFVLIVGFIALMVFMILNNENDKYMLQIGICIGMIVSKVGTVYDYYFGSSKGSSDKNTIINTKLNENTS